MGRVLGAGVLELFFAPDGAFVDDQAPTLAELNDVTVIDLTAFLAPAGIDTPFAGNTADAADWSTPFNKTGAGTFGGQPIEGEFYFDKGNNIAWDTLPRRTIGYLVVVPLGLATPGTFAENDELESWPIDVMTRNRIRTPRQDMQRFMVQASVPAEPLIDYAAPAA